MNKVKNRNESEGKPWITRIHQFIKVLMCQEEELEIVEESNTHFSMSLTSFDY